MFENLEVYQKAVNFADKIIIVENAKNLKIQKKWKHNEKLTD
jgi:hypothetical protein